MALPQAKLDTLLARHAAVEAELANKMPPETFVKLSREFAQLSPLVEKVKAYRSVATEIADLDAMLADPSTEAEMRTMANAERPQLQTKLTALEENIRLALLPKDAMDERNVIIEIRAGTGGDEASLFAGDLFRMYERFAAKQGLKVEVISESAGTIGGYKEIVAEIRGRGAFAKFKFESGVHRVQRVPHTEGSGRIHTSTATVAVLRAILLHSDYDSGRQMRDAYRRFGLVDVLAAGAARTQRIDLEVALVDGDVDLLGLGEHRDGRGGGVNAARSFGVGHALHAVHAGLEFQLGERAASLDLGDDLLVAAHAAFAR